MWSTYWKVGREAWQLSRDSSNAVARRIGAARASSAASPGRRALRTGILAPGDGPPGKSRRAFLDYRGILLPENLKPLSSGVFPIGKVKHPQLSEGAFDCFLEWGDVCKHVAIVGPSGSGKTFGLIAPWACAAAAEGITVVAVDTRGDLLAELIGARQRLGLPSLGLIPWDIDNPQASRSWNPLGEVSAARGSGTVPQLAEQFAQAVLGRPNKADSQPFFAERDRRWLPGLVRALVEAYHPLVPHPALLHRMTIDQRFLLDIFAKASHEAYAAIDLASYPRDEFTRATAGLSNRLAWLSDPGLGGVLAGRGRRSLSLSTVFGTGAVFLVGARMSGGERALSAASLVLNMLRLKCMERYGSQLAPMMWILDECPRYADRIELDVMLDMLRGAGSPVVLAMQDVSQFGTREQQERSLANCNAMITLRGVSRQTGDYLAGRLGERHSATTTSNFNESGQWLPTLGYERQPVLGAAEIMHPPVGRYGGVVHIADLASPPLPFLVTWD